MKAAKQKSGNGGDKNQVTQKDLQAGVKTYKKTDQLHAALETPEGKNNGAEPTVFKNQRKSRT